MIDRGHRKRWWHRLGTRRSGFRLLDADGRPVQDRAARERLDRLHIPPAWRHVRISPFPGGRLQAIGLDEAGRVQYLYNLKFRARQDRKKYAKIEHFGEHLPNLRKVTTQHLSLPGFPKERVLALLVRLVNRLYFRVGSPGGVRRYRTYGATTLQNRHLRILPGGILLFNFDGKHHIHTRRILVDEPFALALGELKNGGGPSLFKYFDADGRPHPLRARDVNDYIKSATTPEFSAKDFRTWAGTLLVAKELARLGKASNQRQAEHNIVQAVRKVAAELGNTPAVCRRAYLHPVVVRAYLKGLALDELAANGSVTRTQQHGYYPDELALLELFQRARSHQLRPDARPATPTPPTLFDSAPASVADIGSTSISVPSSSPLESG